MAGLVSANTHTRDTVVLRNVRLAFWTWLVTRGGEREGSGLSEEQEEEDGLTDQQ